MNLPIRYVGFGMASVLDDEIIMHRDLLDDRWEPLRIWLLHHETQHMEGPYSWQDVKHDVRDTLFKPIEVSKAYLRFFVTHPSAWIQVSPFWIYKGKMWTDFNRLWTWTLLSGILGVAWFLLTRLL